MSSGRPLNCVTPVIRHRWKRRTSVIKLGGELLSNQRNIKKIARALVNATTRQPIIVVHGGGREIDEEMAKIGLKKLSVDGLRITDLDTLDVVLGVLAGRVNTKLVAAIVAAGGSAIGLTGTDASIAPVNPTRSYLAINGSRVNLGFVGVPKDSGPPKLLNELSKAGYVPVVASISSDAKGQLYNVNADTFAGNLAKRLKAEKLIIAGTTPGVIDKAGRTIPIVDDTLLNRLINEGQAHAGMIAKLLACRDAYRAGVNHITIVDGRSNRALDINSSTKMTTVTKTIS